MNRLQITNRTPSGVLPEQADDIEATIAWVIRELHSVQAGCLYALVSAKVELTLFDFVIERLVTREWVERQCQELRWIGPRR